LHY
jgi:hypothetical protein